MTVDLSLFVITFALVAVCVAASFCRIAAIDMRGVQYRYVAPSVLVFVGALGVGVSLLSGEKTPWFEPVILLAVALKMWNSRAEWDGGMPDNFRRACRIRHSSFPALMRRHIVRENLVVVFMTLLAIGVAGVGSASGHSSQQPTARTHADHSGR